MCEKLLIEQKQLFYHFKSKMIDKESVKIYRYSRKVSFSV